MNAVEAIQQLLAGRDVLIDGARYRIIGGRLCVVLETRHFRSDLSLDDILNASIQPCEEDPGEVDA